MTNDKPKFGERTPQTEQEWSHSGSIPTVEPVVLEATKDGSTPSQIASAIVLTTLALALIVPFGIALIRLAMLIGN